MTVGERIKAARKKAGMTQKELADKLGIPYQGISQYERGIRNPKIATVKKIAEALQVSPSELIPGEILASYDAFEVLASDIRDDMIRESATPNEWEEAVNTKVTDIQEGLVYEEREKRRRHFLLTAFNRLNEKGQEKAVEAVENLLFVPDYRNNEKLLGEDIRPDNKKEGKAPGKS